MSYKKSKKEKVEEDFELFDNHNIQDDWEMIKKLISDCHNDMDKILQKRGINATRRVRKNLQLIKKLSHYLRKSLSYQVQDNRGDYDFKNK